ncbi:MAG: DUF6179 domain-containing protein, partial [Limnochordia bacterium]|nr:DUF6179 domain-containing protein [Limnochordia bacterium]
RTMPITEMYRKGRRLINAKFHAARHLYELTQNNRLSTDNYTYSATLTDTGIGLFFRVYDPDYKAHEFPASIDYQLCHPVTDLVGVEFIQKYLENLYLENEFCGYFTAEDIHRLLLGYDPGYRDLPVNIFEHVLGAVLGCVLVERDLRALHISPEDVQLLQNRLSGPDDATLVMGLCMASGIILEELSIASPALQRYINQTLDKVKASIVYALKTHTLDKVFAPSTNRQVKQGIRFVSSAKMDDEEYRKLVEELMVCRYTTDKLLLVKEKVKSFGDLEDLLLDAWLSEGEIMALLGSLQDAELAAMIKRHPYMSQLQAVDLSEAEQTLRFCLKANIDRFSQDRKQQILETVNHIVDE